MKSRLRPHRHPNGHWCHCPFGNAEPYISPHQREVYGGRRQSLWVEASKLDWLRDRPDMQAPESQRFLDRLELAYPDHDALYPWLAREHKKGRIQDPWKEALDLRYPQAHDLYGEPNELWSTPMTFQNHEGYLGQLSPDHLEQVNDWMKYMKQAKKGVDLMKHEVGPAVHEAEKNDIGGENVHTFDNGYWIAKLRNKRDMVKEGDRMHHCVGSPSMGYIDKNNDGSGMFYSLRTPDNQPVGTAEISTRDDHDEYYKCPHCNKFTFGEYGYNPEEGQYVQCSHCAGKLIGDGEPVEGLKQFSNDLRKHKHPDASYTSIAQMFGPHDNKMDEWHNDMFNQYFNQHGHPDYESDGEDEEEEEYEPWWDSYYTVPGARTVDEYMDHRNGDYESYTPEEYDRAQRDAYEHEMEPPELEVEDPDWDDIFEGLAGDKPDPEEINRLWKAARDNGDESELNDRARWWLENEYENYLDPYGEGVSTPYPQSDPNEEYFARNLYHQLGKYRDPQTGTEYGGSYGLRNKYPELRPGTGAGPFGGETQPRFPTTERQQDYQGLMREREWGNRQPGLPFNNTVPPANWQALDRARQPHIRDRENTLQGELDRPKPFVPSGPGNTPEEYFTPGQETVQMHQRALPMQWDPGQTDMPTGPYDPNEPYYYPQGEQQGSLVPQRWYIDYAKKRAQETQLPEHLFMPEHFGYHNPQDPYGHQQKLWTNDKNGPPYGAWVNTGVEQPYGGNDSARNVAWGQRPNVPWTAKMAGPWTDTEDKGGRERPKTDRNKGHGIWDIPVHEGQPHLHGRVVVHNHPSPTTMPGFEWRVPVVYDKDEDRMYVGQRGMEHGDMMKSFHKDNPWGDNFDAQGGMIPGYIDADSHIGSGGLRFFREGEVPNEDELQDWVEKQYGVRNTGEDEKPPLMDWNTDKPDDDREASYHPRQEDEWVAEDEPVFSALIPEPRWKV